MNSTKLSVAVIGYGKVGRVLARAFVSIGYHIIGIVDSDSINDEWLQQNRIALYNDVKDLPVDIDFVVISVPDRCLESIVEQIVSRNGFRNGTVVAHTAGALSTDPLEPIRSFGAVPLAMHPLQTFTGNETIEQLKGITFGISGDPVAVTVGERIAVDLGGKVVVIPNDMRALYHLSAVFVSNLMAGLVGMSLQLMGDVGLDERTALEALKPLLQTSLDNILALGLPDAITGPVQRGDVDTVAKHLEILSQYPETLIIYKTLSLELLKRCGDITNQVKMSQLIDNRNLEEI